ncbi:uncharacterized protein LOC113297436 isoform X2 [Papaver somniferum]|uniref:uncharacterized protein LOC113297436 isoform X2 n=1 Tax=Papaver somniferum TaxID=3469 RepID=UPI000E7037E0|nr:uncharacterized protein LOC113297436 isoform X2 [Papaver somniferum]
MAGGVDHQKHLLSLIRDFATEKSQGERRVVGLKKRIQDLESELDKENTQLEEAKRCKETAEQELKGYEFELALNEASVQALETRISATQDEISKIGSVVDAIKDQECLSRDEFINQMFEFNQQIRKLQEIVAHGSAKDDCADASTDNGILAEGDKQMVHLKSALKDLEDKIADITSQTRIEEQEYQEGEHINKKVKCEMAYLEKREIMLESIVKEMKHLQELTKQTTESEEECASLGEELQRRSKCPDCHLDNVGALGEILQTEKGMDASHSTDAPET